MRRLLAGVAVVPAVLLATVAPAQAVAPGVEFTSPIDEQRFGSSTFAFSATVRMAGGGTVRGTVRVNWASVENRPVPPATTVAANNANSQSVQIPDRHFPWNGRYRVDVTASGRDGGTFDTNGEETSTHSADFVVDAAPLPPGGVTTAVHGDRKVSVSWQANGEPDMVGYEVQRQLGSEPWEHVTVTDKATTSALDSSTAQRGGTYRYRVVAFRSSADADTLNPSLPSNHSTATVPAAPVTTTTTTTTTAPPEEDEEKEEQRSTGGGRSGTSTGSGWTGGRTGSGSTGSTSGSVSGSTSATLPTSGKVDLSGFASLLEQARRSGQAPPALAGEGDDGGFDETLPFSGRPRADAADDGDPAGDDVAIVEEGVSDDGPGRLQSVAFLAGGLLATVLVMHLLWVRSEVRRAGVLETVAPEPPPARPPRRRRFAPKPEEPSDEREPAAVG